MKTIIIPKRFGYPTVEITINGREYSLQSGIEISVEDSVAEAVENAIALAPKMGVPRNRLARLVEGSLAEITAEDLEGISTLSSCAFYGNLGLVKVTIPNGIKTIVGNAFGYCVMLESVTLPEVPPTLANINAFDSIKATCTFYCKTQESLAAYKTAANWSTLSGKYTFAVKS